MSDRSRAAVIVNHHLTEARHRENRGPAKARGGGRGAGCATMSVLSVFDSPWPRATNPGISSTSSTPGFSGRPCEEPSPRAVLGDLEHTLYRDTYARTCGTSPRPGGRRARGGDASRCRLGGYVQCGSRRRRAGRRRRRPRADVAGRRPRGAGAAARSSSSCSRRRRCPRRRRRPHRGRPRCSGRCPRRRRRGCRRSRSGLRPPARPSLPFTWGFGPPWPCAPPSSPRSAIMVSS